ncbi:MAG: enoyl-CoA hydratase-related protein [Actinomycetota bacterium]|nr:enoyl-CoA hydratase-related protein [Actinomycetota bacterium]MDA3023159.1 enoyl-CoA hydratase-related protein [Actinomycetota bacterium]
MRLEVDAATRVGAVVIDRPPLNALDLAAWGELAAVVAEVAERDDVRALLVRGGPRAFAAGADVREFLDWGQDQAHAAAGIMQAALDGLAALPMVTIAVISGYALGGGCELALACDLRFAADNAKMGQPEILLGVIPGIGGTQRLARLVGAGRAKDLVFSGRMVDMVEAPRIGLVDAVHPVDDVLAAATHAAARYAAGPAALALAKRAIDEGLDGTLAEGLRLERELFAATFATDDLRIGVTSFLADGPGVAPFTGH